MTNKKVVIDHQVQYCKNGEKVQFFATTTKTNAGKRVILMTEEVYEMFTEQRKVWLQSKKDSEFEVDGYKKFVFVSHVTGKCMIHRNVRRMLRKIVSMNGERQIQLQDISPHILRHTCAARLGQRQDVILKCFNTLWGILISEPHCRYIIMWMKDV